MFVQFCPCVGVENFEKVKEVVISNGPFQKTVLYCCEKCYKNYFAETSLV